MAHPETFADDPTQGADSKTSSPDLPLSDEDAANTTAEIDRLRQGRSDVAGRPPVHALLDHAEATLGATASASEATDAAVAPETRATEQQWSPRRRLAFFVGVNGLCWALILLPVLL